MYILQSSSPIIIIYFVSNLLLDYLKKKRTLDTEEVLEDRFVEHSPDEKKVPLDYFREKHRHDRRKGHLDHSKKKHTHDTKKGHVDHSKKKPTPDTKKGHEKHLRKKPTPDTKKYRKKFVYYTQTEECVPKYLTRKYTLGDGSRLDFFVLSYRKPCKSPLTPSHFHYIFTDKNTTWASGRNTIFEYVKLLGLRYMYHIFIDDDAQLFFTKTLEDSSLEPEEFKNNSPLFKRALRVKNKGRSPWRELEDTLLQKRPAVMATNMILPGFMEASKNIQERNYKMICAPGSKMPEITPTFFFDTIIIAYHEKALPLVMPMSTMFDFVNWDTAAHIQMFKTKALFHKQVITHWGLCVINDVHRSYPRNPYPVDFMKRYFEEAEPGLEFILDERDRVVVPFSYGARGYWTNVFFKDKVVCSDSVKFPVTDYYKNEGNVNA